jgi:ABC-type multidrug transport system permease subunit
MKKFLSLFHARNMEFFRDRGTLIWNIAFPLLLVFGFAFAFSGGNETLFTVGTFGEQPSEFAFAELRHVDFVSYEDRSEAAQRVRRHQVDMLIDFESQAYLINENSANGYMVERLFTDLHGQGFSKQAVSGEPVRFVDWFVPGVIGMNMMFSGIFGVGFVIVRYRKNGFLKRLKATPISSLEFVGSQVASRFLIVVVSSAVVFTLTNLALDFVMLGSYINLLLVTMLGVMCMISFGLIFATRIKSEELAGGLMNVVTLPMLLLSGVFFSLETTPQIVQRISQAMPLTHFVSSARSIMLDGAGLAEIFPSLLLLLGFTVLFLAISSVLFRWE